MIPKAALLTATVEASGVKSSTGPRTEPCFRTRWPVSLGCMGGWNTAANQYPGFFNLHSWAFWGWTNPTEESGGWSRRGSTLPTDCAPSCGGTPTSGRRLYGTVYGGTRCGPAVLPDAVALLRQDYDPRRCWSWSAGPSIKIPTKLWEFYLPEFEPMFIQKEAADESQAKHPAASGLSGVERGGFNILRIGLLAYPAYGTVVNYLLSVLVFAVFQWMIFGKR